jgi:hypothetical protein
MEETAENGKESSHFAQANGMNESNIIAICVELKNHGTITLLFTGNK